MNKTKWSCKAGVLLFLAACLTAATVQDLSAQASIPQGSTINSAVFSIYSTDTPTHMTVNLHRITVDWGEYSVTWNTFAGSFDPAIIGSFTVNSTGWQTVDVTLLVQAWVNGVYPNFGIALEQGKTLYNVYHSSEALTVSLRPKLDIQYTTPGGIPGHLVLQRPEAAQNGVADAYIWALNPTYNGGGAQTLWTGNVPDSLNQYGEKYSLLRFHFTVTPPPPGTGTPGYWKNHPEAWPSPGITIGGVYYSKETAIGWMTTPVSRDKTLTMFNALVAAKLNVLAGNSDSCIASFIAQADDWMTAHPVGSHILAGGLWSAWRVGQPIYSMLDAYNNGLLACAQHRD